jgi:Glycosyl transferases group 1
MRKKIKTLYLTSNGFGKVVVTTDTVLRGLLRAKDGTPPPKMFQNNKYVVNLYAHLRQFYDALSYIGDWQDAFVRSPRLDVEVCNINNLIHFAGCMLKIRSYDLIVVSHAAAGDDMTILTRAAPVFGLRACPLIMFIGNEYDLLDEKIGFMLRVKADRVCSQLPIEAARYLYEGVEPSRVLSMPHALNPNVYTPPVTEEREIDIGFIGDIYWPFVGDEERTHMIRHFQDHAANYGLKSDIRAGQMLRLPRDEWAAFLRSSKGLIGAESGTYYLNDRGKLLTRARDYNLKENQQATFADVFDRFYAGVTPSVSGKSVSSRHFEPVGAKCCQILLEGDYNGTLTAGEHYIPVKRDLSNVAEAVRQFKDEGHRRKIADQAYEHVMASHTYERRVEFALSTLF